MMCVDVAQRLSSKDVLSHKWMQLTGRQVDDIMERTGDDRVSIDDDVLTQVCTSGFESQAVRDSLANKKLNHATACYFNLVRCYT